MKQNLLILISLLIVSGLAIFKGNAQNNSTFTEVHKQDMKSSSSTSNDIIKPWIEDNSGCFEKSSGGRAGKTGSPGETTCTSCHSGTSNTGGGSITVNAPGLSGWAYTPGQTYTIDVTVMHSGAPLFGFGFEALLSTGANAGTLIITNTVETLIKTAAISGNVRNNVVHQSNGGLTTNSHTFTFNWTAPTSGTGSITFYAVGLACDNTGGTSGDFTYNSSQVVTEATTSPPVASFNASNTTICESTSISFTDQSTNTPTTWAWDFGDGQTSNLQSPVYTYATAGIYTVALTATNAGGSNTSTMTNYITVNPEVVPTVSINTNTPSVCPGTTTAILASSTNGGVPTYSWSVDGNVVGTGDTYSAVFTNGQSVVCTMTSTASCANPASVSSSPLITSVFSVTPVTIIETTGTLNSDAISGNQWYEQSGGIIAGANGQTYSPTSNGNYYSVVTDGNGCVTSSNILNFIYVGISENYLNSSIVIYPNPSKGLINISFENSINGKLTIEDYTGKVVYNEKINHKNGTVKTIDLSKYSNGVYFIKIDNKEFKVFLNK